MSVQEFWKVLVKRWRTIVACLVVGVVVAGMTVLLMPTTYAATVTAYISTQGDRGDSIAAYQGSLLSEQRVQSYLQLFQTDRIPVEVKRQLGLTDPVEDIAEQMAISAQPETVVLTITVTDQSSDLSLAIANEAAEALVGLVADVERPAAPNVPPTVVARIVQPAELAPDPVSPRPVLYLILGLVAGTAVGVVAAVIVNARDRSVNSEDGLATASGAPVVGLISHVDRPIENNTNGLQIPAAIAEELRQVRTNLQFIIPAHHSRVIAVTSSLPGEGKSTTAAGLSAILGMSGERVLLIEADLRRPGLGSMLGVQEDVGLSALLVGRAQFKGVVQAGPGGVFDVISAGRQPPNPAELLGSQAMNEVLDTARGLYETVVLDCPPVLPVTDAAVLSTKVDGTLLVCQWSATSKASVERTASDIHTAMGTISGSVLTKVKGGGPRPTRDYDTYRGEGAVVLGGTGIGGRGGVTNRAAQSSTTDVRGGSLRNARPTPHRRQV